MFRVMLYDDLREVLRIELDSFAHPWSEQDFLEHLANPQSVAIVAERDDRIVGYVVFGIGKLKPWVQLYSCVVCRNFRRRGLGSEMVTCLMRGATARKLGGVTVKVPERNLDAQLFFRQLGFRAFKTLPAYLSDGQDAYVMAYSRSGWEVPSFDVKLVEDELTPLWEVKHSGVGS